MFSTSETLENNLEIKMRIISNEDSLGYTPLSVELIVLDLLQSSPAAALHADTTSRFTALHLHRFTN